MLKKLFDNKIFIFIITFIVQMIFYFIFEYLFIGGDYILPDIGLAPIAGLVFGPVGALGNALAGFVFEIYDGINLLSAFLDALINFFISILTFKLWYSAFIKKPINTPKFDSIYNLLKFFSIMFLVSLTYWTLICLCAGAYLKFIILYPLTGFANISYFLNMFNFSVIFGLLTVSVLNILKFPMQIPERWINLSNIQYKYFIIMLIILFIYSILTIVTNLIDNDILDNIFFLMTAVTAILFLFNHFDVRLNIQHTNYSIIEQIILIFLFILAITIATVFDEFLMTISILLKQLDTDFLITITVAYCSVIIIFLSTIHIYGVEKTITNPLYHLISIVNSYNITGKFPQQSELTGILGKYMKNDDDISRLINSFILLNNHIQESLSQIENIVGEKERIETEFNIASRIQTHMLKTDFEEFCKDKGFEIYGFMNPAREVGGDFYDYFQIDDENIGFVIGDVSGKGVPATLFMIKAMYLIRSHSKFNESPNEVFENVNNLLCERNDGELFVTSWFGKLNLKTGKLTFVNAGHNPPLIKQNMDYENREEETNPDNENGIDEYKDNNASNKSKDFEYLNIRPNLVLGGMEGIQYKEHELNLKTGDILFLYTDGITEANSNYNGFYGEDRLKETINKYGNESLDRIIENIKNDVYEFCRDENQFDDMTMLILKYNGSENNG